MGIEHAGEKAAGFYAIMFFYYSAYDGANNKEKVKEEFDSAINSMVQDLNKN